MDDVVLNLSDELLDRLGSARAVLSVTDDGRDPALVYTRRLAAQLAARLEVGLFLADRSQETWGDNEHVRGPADLDWLRSNGIAYMVEQVEEAQAAGVSEVHGVASSMPSLESFDAVVSTTGADVVVAPDQLRQAQALAAPLLAAAQQMHVDKRDRAEPDDAQPRCTSALCEADRFRHAVIDHGRQVHSR